MFFKNLASWDRIARIVLGLAVVSLAFWGPRTPWAYLGIIFPITAALGHCPIYRLLGIRTCPRDESKKVR